MPEYVHGGDVYSYAEAYGGAPLDLSANINPFGIPEAVKQAMHDAVEDCTRYPDPFCRAARRAIGAAEGVDPDWLYCGNGAADVLDRLAAVLRPKTALLTAPTFAEYERTLAGAERRLHLLREEEGFAVDRADPFGHHAGNRRGLSVQPQQPDRAHDRAAAFAQGCGKVREKRYLAHCGRVL